MAVSKPLRYQILKRDKNKCRTCGRGPDEVKLQIDHVVPVSLGGTDDPSNLQVLCADCNGGKSSTPADAPMVADVAEDARRWAQAMSVVAEQRAADREVRQHRYDAFLREWNNWTYEGRWKSSGGYERRTYDLPGGWQNSIDQFLDAGLELGDLYEMVNVAMGSQSPDKWRYFCGCCWNRVRAAHDQAQAIVSQPPAQEPSLKISTRWDQDDLDYLLNLEGIGTKYSGGLFECEDHADGLCEQDTLCQIAAAARTREAIDAHLRGKWERDREAEAINDTADEAEDYIYG